MNAWAAQQWGSAALGDKRRTQRGIHLAAQMAALPAAGLPGQTQSWSELKAAYRLLHEDDVTHQALSLPHWQHTWQLAEHI
ncbi:IS4/Tn5 family transposase DNA-binding protein, partial [Escherichia coli]|uniref:IS4/Tn5 family transposase DNA-binding protein n=1 Tax=Escherichia coli TaxID=562 RepID=UPI000CC37B67